MTRVLIGNSAWVFSKIEVIWVPGTHWPLVLWVWTYPPNCVPRARFSGKLRWKSEYQFFWEPPGKYIFFQATALLILGVSSWWKWTSQPLFSKLLKIGIWMYLDVFGRCIFWRSILNHLWLTHIFKIQPEQSWDFEGLPRTKAASWSLKNAGLYFPYDIASASHCRFGGYCTSWNAKCPISWGNFTPKTSNYCLKNRALSFPGSSISIIKQRHGSRPWNFARLTKEGWLKRKDPILPSRPRLTTLTWRWLNCFRSSCPSESETTSETGCVYSSLFGDLEPETGYPLKRNGPTFQFGNKWQPWGLEIRIGNFQGVLWGKTPVRHLNRTHRYHR